MDGPIVGVDLGGTNMQIGVVGPDNALLARAKRKTRADEGMDPVLERLIAGITEACEKAAVSPSDLLAVGIGAPGVIDPAGIVVEAVNLRWNNVPLPKILSERIGVPVYVDNDVNAAIYGEHQLGAAKGAAFVLGIWVGTGIGGGLILNNQLYYGRHLSAGEIGHTILFPGNPPGIRSLENTCSRTAVVDRLVRLIKGNHSSLLLDLAEGDIASIKAKTIAEAYRKGDALTNEVVDAVADLVGVAAANAVTLLSLERVVLGGGLTEAVGHAFVRRVRESARKHAFPEAARTVDVVASELEDDAGVLGAALLARQRAGL